MRCLFNALAHFFKIRSFDTFDLACAGYLNLHLYLRVDTQTHARTHMHLFSRSEWSAPTHKHHSHGDAAVSRRDKGPALTQPEFSPEETTEEVEGLCGLQNPEEKSSVWEEVPRWRLNPVDLSPSR